MREIAKKTIDGHEYEFAQFGAKESLRVLMKLSKIVGKPIILAVETLKKDKGATEFNYKMLAEAAGILFQSMDEDEALLLIEKLTAEAVLCDGKKVNFDVHYKEKGLSHLFDVLAAALEVQYGNFFDELLEKLPSAKSAGSTPAPSTST